MADDTLILGSSTVTEKDLSGPAKEKNAYLKKLAATLKEMGTRDEAEKQGRKFALKLLSNEKNVVLSLYDQLVFAKYPCPGSDRAEQVKACEARVDAIYRFAKTKNRNSRPFGDLIIEKLSKKK